MKPQVTLFFPVYNQSELLRVALATLDQTEFRGFKAVVLDDNSTEPVQYLVESIRDDVDYPLEYEPVTTRIGVSTVLINRGILNATTEYVAYMNSDVSFPDPKWLGQTLDCFHRFRFAGAVGIKQLYPSGSVCHNGTRYNIDGSWTTLDRNKGAQESACESGYVEGVTGCGLFTLRSIWQSVGGFQMFHPYGWDDVAYCLQLHRLGYRIICQREHPIIHWQSKSYGAPKTPHYYENCLHIRAHYGDVIDQIILERPN